MNTISPVVSMTREEPNQEVLRSQGWFIKSVYGRYCVAWQTPNREVLLVWRDQNWFRVHGGANVA